MTYYLHAYLEMKVNGKWIMAGKVPFNYFHDDLMEKMAGVSKKPQGITPICKPKGLPANISESVLVFNNHNKPYNFNASWFNFKEMQELVTWCESQPPDCVYWGEDSKGEERDDDSPFDISICGNPAMHWEPGANGYPKDIQDLRMVFWFD